RHPHVAGRVDLDPGVAAEPIERVAGLRRDRGAGPGARRAVPLREPAEVREALAVEVGDPDVAIAVDRDAHGSVTPPPRGRTASSTRPTKPRTPRPSTGAGSAGRVGKGAATHREPTGSEGDRDDHAGFRAPRAELCRAFRQNLAGPHPGPVID